MTTQLTLLPSTTPVAPARPGPWHLDDATRATGREGLARARRALAEAKTRCGDHEVTVDPFSHAA